MHDISKVKNDYTAEARRDLAQKEKIMAQNPSIPRAASSMQNTHLPTLLGREGISEQNL
jgi:hypothetical protein